MLLLDSPMADESLCTALQTHNIGINNMSTNVFKLVDGERIELTEPENETRLAKSVAAQENQNAGAWLQRRLAEYPSMADQLDNLYHNGLESWRADIAAIKLRHPKPE